MKCVFSECVCLHTVSWLSTLSSGKYPALPGDSGLKKKGSYVEDLTHTHNCLGSAVLLEKPLRGQTAAVKSRTWIQGAVFDKFLKEDYFCNISFWGLPSISLIASNLPSDLGNRNVTCLGSWTMVAAKETTLDVLFFFCLFDLHYCWFWQWKHSHLLPVILQQVTEVQLKETGYRASDHAWVHFQGSFQKVKLLYRLTHTEVFTVNTLKFYDLGA